MFQSWCAGSIALLLGSLVASFEKMRRLDLIFSEALSSSKIL